MIRRPNWRSPPIRADCGSGWRSSCRRAASTRCAARSGWRTARRTWRRRARSTRCTRRTVWRRPSSTHPSWRGSNRRCVRVLRGRSSFPATAFSIRLTQPGGVSSARWRWARRCESSARRSRSVAARCANGVEETISAGAIVMAAGVDAPGLMAELPIVPRKGHLVITDRYPGLCRAQLVEMGYLRSAHGLGGASVAFNLQPRATGQLLIGSSRELVGRDGAVNHAVLGEMVRRATWFVPALSRCDAIRVWTGFRPATPDGLPLIGRWHAVPGLWVAAGHEGLGITTAPATAALIAADIMGRAAPIDPAPYRPARAMRRDVNGQQAEASCRAT